MQSKQEIKGTFSDWFALFIATTGFTGLIIKNGKGAGTIGALVAVALQVVMLWLQASFVDVLVVAVVSFIVGVFTVEQAEAFILRRYGPRRRHDGSLVSHDFNQTNWDEFHGQMLAGSMVFLISGNEEYPFHIACIMLSFSFLTFRLFDITKPGMIGMVERELSGTALGLMLDDSLAGAFAFVATFFFWWGTTAML